MDPLEEHNLAHPTPTHTNNRTPLRGLPAARDRLTVNSAFAPVGEPSSRTGEPLEAARSYRPERELTATHPTRRTQERHHDQRTLHPYQMDRRSGRHTVPAPARWMTRGRSLHG
jgi:hypothetical protein